MAENEAVRNVAIRGMVIGGGKEAPCPHNKGLTIDPCCEDCGYKNAAFFCVDCNKKIDREEWEYEHERDWDDYGS